jgi:DNA-binding transcriptional MerR regulator
MSPHSSPGPRRRIGQVVDTLRDEFPDISISKLRFLEDKGIIVPERTPGGYRMYSDADVEALRAALHMQRDQFLPLKVIREELRRRIEAGPASGGAQGAAGSPVVAAVPGAVRPAGTLPPVGEVRLGAPEQLVTAEAIVRASGTSHEFLEECRANDVISGRREADGVVRYTQDELGLVTMAGALSRLGLDVRHLRQAATAMGRQGALVEQYAAAILRAPGADNHERALRTVETLTAQLAEFMRIAFVRDVKLMTARAAGVGATGHGRGAPVPPRAAAAGITRS